jgi:hypothetical protein
MDPVLEFFLHRFSYIVPEAASPDIILRVIAV